MSVTFRPAVRENVGLIVGIAGPSGSGKTFSALRLAAGMSMGKPFAVIDTEAGRAKHYADRFAFDHADLQPPFRPGAYADAIKAADEAHYPVIVVDSCSHEHAGEGGLLDWHEEELDRMAGQDWKKRESCKMAAWIKPKTAHKRFVSSMLQVRAHLILCFRAEQKIEIVTNNGRAEIQPKKIASGFSDWIPICEKNLLYELTASFLLTPEHPGIPKPIKLEAQHKTVISVTSPLDEQAGRKLAEWAKGGTTTEPKGIPITASTYGLIEDVKQAKAERASAQALQDAAQALAGEPVEVTVEDTATPPFIWRMGKWKSAHITDIDTSYLEWFVESGKDGDHKEAARAELERRQNQVSLMGSESEEVA
jgi:hypothetical protein